MMSQEYATTRQEFLTATASYLGLDPEFIGFGSHVTFDGQDDTMRAVLHVLLKPSDIVGIGKRMQALAEASNGIVESHMPEPVMGENRTTAAMRTEYNELSNAYGGGILGEMNRTHLEINELERGMQEARDAAARQVTHIDATEEPEPTNMEAVWLAADDCSVAQRQHASDWDHPNDRCLIQWAMLTDEQKQKAQEAIK